MKGSSCGLFSISEIEALKRDANIQDLRDILNLSSEHTNREMQDNLNKNVSFYTFFFFFYHAHVKAEQPGNTMISMQTGFYESSSESNLRVACRWQLH